MPPLTVAMQLITSWLEIVGVLYDAKYSKNYVHIPKWSHRTLQDYVDAFIVAFSIRYSPFYPKKL